MRYKTPRGAVLTACLVAGLAGVPDAASAENLFSFNSSGLRENGSGLRGDRTGPATGLSVQGLEWGGDAARPTPHYGLRVTHFPDSHPNWGVGLDFTHYKLQTSTDRAWLLDGARLGSTNGIAGGSERGGRFDVSQGVNVLSLNGIYRWGDLGNPERRLQPYVGVGLAYYLPRSEHLGFGPDQESAYETSGFGYHLLGGLRYRITEQMGAFVEAKFNRSNAQFNRTDTDASLRNFHAVAGVNYSF